MSSSSNYQLRFPVGTKVNVAIPVPQGDTFYDWALINSIDEDLVTLQLSRDELPSGVKLSTGLILDIRVGQDDKGYSCRGILVTEGYLRTMVLRLIGEIVSNELREFYRIDAFLPIRYFITSETSETAMKTAWKEKREARLAAEQLRRENEKKPWERLRDLKNEEQPEEELTGGHLRSPAEKSNDAAEETEEDDGLDHSWDDVIPLAANISGGGLRILLHHQFSEGDLVPVEIFLPSEPRPQIIDAVCKVAFSRENQAAEKQFNRPTFNTGFHFVWIDERERDALVSYISNVQLKRIRMLREHYLTRDGRESEAPALDPQQQLLARIKQAGVIAVALIILVAMGLYFKNYAENKPKGELEMIFEKGFMDFFNKKSGRPSNIP